MIPIIGRKEWYAKDAKESHPLILPLNSVVNKYTEIETCTNQHECCKVIRGLQQAAFMKGLPDLPYNFLIGGDLRIYEGRGWSHKVFDRKLVLGFITYLSGPEELLDDMNNMAYYFLQQNEDKMLKIFYDPKTIKEEDDKKI